MDRRKTDKRLQPIAGVHASSWLKVCLLIAAGVLIALAVVFAVWRYRSDANDSLVALRASFSNHRPTEARIAAFRHAPFVSTRGAENEAITFEIIQTELALRTRLRDRPSPALHHALGQVLLAKREFDNAIKEFDKALAADPNNPVLYSDLGAAWLEAAKLSESDKVAGLARSLSSIERALELKPNQLEALFNRGIVHQYLMLSENAEVDWQEYLSKDPSSEWAKEARGNLDTLHDQERHSGTSNRDFKAEFIAAFQERNADRGWDLIRQSRDTAPTGQWIRDLLIDSYLQSLVNGEKQQAEQLLQALAFAGQIELDRTQDAYTAQLAQFYRSSGNKHRELLISARQTMALAQRNISESKPLEALSLFEKSKQQFATIGDSSEASLADMWIGYAHNNAADRKRSISILSPLARLFERENFRWLHMRTLYLLAGAEFNAGKYSRGIENNQASLKIAEQIEDSRSAFNILSILVEQYRYIGNYEKSLECIQRSLALLNSCNLNAQQVGQYFSIIAAALSSSELDRAAADYQRSALQTLLKTSQIQTISRAHANLGTIYGRLGRYAEGLEQVTQGYGTAKSLSDERVRKGMMAYSAQRMGDLYRQSGNVAGALQSYQECLELYESLGNYYGLYEVHKSLVLSHIASGDDVAIGKELEVTLALIERYRSQILEENNRNHFFGNEQSIYDLAMDYEYSRRKNPEKAFDYSEASRSRSLLDLATAKGAISANSSDRNTDLVFRSVSQPLSLNEIRQQMPKEAQIVQYAVLKDKLLIWLISRNGVHSTTQAITKEQLSQKINSYVKLISDGPAVEETQLAKELFEVLVKPIEGRLEKDRAIYFVPDKALNSLPFAALVSPESGRYLIQDYTVAITPSSTLFVRSSAAGRDKDLSGEERILSVGNPRFNMVQYPALADLPSAQMEAEEVARYYTSRSILTGNRATRSAVEKEMERASVFQFAGHSLVDPQLPFRSRLVLAATKGDNNQELETDLEARDIYGMKLTQTRLVVLSSCESGIGKYFAGEGVMNLARPFLAANVPMVIASLWPVSSDTTTALMISFHKHRKLEKRPSVDALRRAQLDLLSSSDERARRVYSWAAFTPVGGWVDF